MTKDAQIRDDEFLVQHLVDPKDWVADHARSLCNVCTRAFGTFRRKHHCRMCGEVVCSNCTLHKNAMLPTIGYTRVRVCMSCVFAHSNVQKPKSISPRMTMPDSPVSMSEESRQWVNSHLHSPVSRSHASDGDENQSPSQEDSNQHNSICHSNSTASMGNQSEDAYDFSWEHPWPKPPVSPDEQDRLEVLQGLGVLDTPPEKPFDMICELARARLSCPMAAVSFMDEHRQWFKASTGLAHKMIPRKIAFCAYTIYLKEPVVVLDTLKDRRFEANPLVSGAAEVRFYAAAPIIDPLSGHAVGSVFVLDTRPRESCDITVLERLAHAASENLPCGSPEHPDEGDLDDLDDSQTRKSTDNNDNPEDEDAVHDDQASSTSSAIVASQGGKASTAESTSLANVNSSVASNEQMEVLLMRLLTQNTETQQQLAQQQFSMSKTLGYHSQQISQLMSDFSKMEAKLEAKMKAKSGDSR